VAATQQTHDQHPHPVRAGVSSWVQRAHEGAAVGAAVIGPDGTLLWVNRAMLDLVGFPGAELVGHSVAELVHESDRERMTDALAALGEQPISMARVQGPTPGSWLHVSLSLLPAEGDHGPAILAQAVDVTSSVQTQVSLEVMSENVLDVVTLIDDAGRITWASPSVRAVLGPESDSAEIIGREITRLIAHEDLQGFTDALAGSEPGQEPTTRTVRFRSSSGAYRYMSVTARPVADAGTGRRTAIAMRDVTEELRAKRELARSEEQFRMAMLGAPEGMAVTDSQDRIVQVNPALCELLGTSSQALIGHRFREYIPEEEREQVDQWRERLLWGNIAIERCQHRLTSHTSEVWVDHSVGIMRDDLGNPALFVHQFADRTAARRLEADLTYKASHDLQTGLANKESLKTRLTQRLGMPPESASTVGVLFCDIDNLKPINDRYGHLVGDAVISAVANRLERAVRRQDEVARYGGDEFFIVLDHCDSIQELALVARNVQSAASHPVETSMGAIDVSISVGAVLAESTAETDEALRRADEALYRAKRSGGNRIGVEGLSDS
jgi:diguanylate cyclase (GGDEF)-like protein/PAS domain S-box-containing protein